MVFSQVNVFEVLEVLIGVRIVDQLGGIARLGVSQSLDVNAK
jgi:hypothetical protein